MAPNPTRPSLLRERKRGGASGRSNGRLSAGLRAFVPFALVLSFVAPSDLPAQSEFLPPGPASEFLPAAPGEPPVDLCSEWNPEFGYRGYKCCADASRAPAANRRGRRRRRNACAPNRVNWTFCSEMTAAHRDYVQGVKAGRIDVLEHVQKSMGSKGGQNFCGVSNGFLVEGRPLVPTPGNRIELRNEGRCANFGTDPMVGAFEWLGREIKREYHEPEFEKARLIVGDLSAPRGGCISGRFGRRAHKSHTSGVDIDFAYFNPRAGHSPEERFTRNFYVASNWWMLKKLFRNPLACVKVVFLDSRNIGKLAKYAKDDPDWNRFKPFIRHVRGHRDHFHVRFGTGPGVAGCASDPNLEEDEDIADEAEGALVKGEEAKEEGEEGAPAKPGDPARALAAAPGEPATEDMRSLASGVEIAQTTLPPHKLEPSITAKFEERPRRRKKRGGRQAQHVSRRASRRTN